MNGKALGLGAGGRSIGLIGSGSSLNQVDVCRLSDSETITFNRSWLAWREWGFRPTFHASLDPSTIAVLGPELPCVVEAHPNVRFFLHEDAALHGVHAAANVTFCHFVRSRFFTGRVDALVALGNVGAMSVQILHALGYDRVQMVGVDGYKMQPVGVVHDVNYFRDDYARGAGEVSRDLRRRYAEDWRFVASECDRLGISVKNSSPGTSLECIPTIPYEEGLAWIGNCGGCPGRSDRLFETT